MLTNGTLVHSWTVPSWKAILTPFLKLWQYVVSALHPPGVLFTSGQNILWPLSASKLRSDKQENMDSLVILSWVPHSILTLNYAMVPVHLSAVRKLHLSIPWKEAGVNQLSNLRSHQKVD